MFNRKIFLIIGLILVSLFFGFLIFYFFFYTQQITGPAIPPETSTTTTGNYLPSPGTGRLPGQIITTPVLPGQTSTPGNPIIISPVAKGGLTQTMPIYQNPVFGSIITPENDLISYDKITGKFVRISPDGKLNYMSDRIFYNVEKITWSPNAVEAILEYPDGSNIVYNFKTQKQVTLPKQWEDFSFSPSSKQLVTKNLSSNAEYNWLVVSDDSGSNVTPVERLGENGDKVYVNWSPNNNVIALYAESKDFDRQNLFFLGKNQENFPLTVIEGRGFQGKWSKTGDRLLYSVYNSESNFKPMVWTVTTDPEDMSQYRKKLNLNTWADKCYFYDNETVYCAVPESLPEGSGIFPEVADGIPDNIYKVNIKTDEKQFIARPADNATVESLFISDDGKYLFYTDKQTGILKKIDLQ